MNEEQKEQNIPAPAPLISNNQNIALHKGWQIKSWQIIVAGVIIQMIIFIPYLTGKLKDADDPAGLIYGSLFLFLILGVNTMLSFLSGILLYFEKTRKIGAILSIIFGVLGLNIFSFTMIALGGIIRLSLLAAGIYYFWKKV